MSDRTWRDDPAWPDVDVVMPIRNEEPHLGAALAAVLAQGYSGTIRIFMGVGPSDDRTEQIAHALAASEPRLTIVANPSGRTPSALNLAIGAGVAPVVVRVDGHSQLSDGYIERAVDTLRRTGASNVGGMQVPVPTTPFEEAVAVATTSMLGTGGASYRVGGVEADVDTVYLGVFDRSAIEAVGLFDEDLIRNQDYELNIRLRRAGGRVVFDPELSVGYQPRSSWTALTRQYYGYGQWKAVVMRMYPDAIKLRQLIPPIGLVSVLIGTVISLRWRLAAVVPACYLLALGTAARRAPRPTTTAAVIVATHSSWVAGLLTRLLRP